MSIYKETGMIDEKNRDSEPTGLAEQTSDLSLADAEMLNDVYRDISDLLGMDIAHEIFCLFKGQQISFPIRFFNPAMIREMIAAEYDGTNARQLAVKYDYSEKTIRRIVKGK